MAISIPLSPIGPYVNCVLCKKPPPEGQSQSHSAAQEGETHVACLPCVQTLRNQGGNQSAFCPEECGYDFNERRTCAEKASRWWSGHSAQFAGFAKGTIKNPIVIMMCSGGAALGLTAAVSLKTSIIVIGSCAALPLGRFVYDLYRNQNSSAPSFLLGLISPYMGLFMAPLSEKVSPLAAGALALLAGLAPFVSFYTRPRNPNQPINFSYALAVNTIASLLLFSSSVLSGAKIETAGLAGGVAFGFSTLIASCSRIGNSICE